MLRQDPLTGEWVIIATERAKRPETFAQKKEEGRDPLPSRVEDCPFCPGNEHMTPPQVLAYHQEVGSPSLGRDRIYSTATLTWALRVIPNKFPALEKSSSQESLELLQDPARPCRDNFFRSYQGYGVHEVIIETPHHNRQLKDLELEELLLLVKAFRERILSLSGDPHLRYVQIFRNHKREAGASIEHPHCQLIALPYIPPLLEKEYRRAHDYYLEEGKCLLCTLLEEEEKKGERVVLSNDSFLAYIPFAAPLPFTTWIVPREHFSSLELSGGKVEEKMASILKEYMGRLASRLEDPPYNLYLHGSPLRSDSLPYFHWHIEIIPKLTIVAGWEMATGTYINVSRPEEAASFLRKG